MLTVKEDTRVLVVGSGMKHPPQLRERAMQMVFDLREESGAGGTASEDKKKIAELERELREANRPIGILKAASAYFAREIGAGPAAALVEFIDSCRDRFGAEPVCTGRDFVIDYYAAKNMAREEAGMRFYSS